MRLERPVPSERRGENEEALLGRIENAQDQSDSGDTPVAVVDQKVLEGHKIVFRHLGSELVGRVREGEEEGEPESGGVVEEGDLVTREVGVVPQQDHRGGDFEEVAGSVESEDLDQVHKCCLSLPDHVLDPTQLRDREVCGKGGVSLTDTHPHVSLFDGHQVVGSIPTHPYLVLGIYGFVELSEPPYDQGFRLRRDSGKELDCLRQFGLRIHLQEIVVDGHGEWLAHILLKSQEYWLPFRCYLGVGEYKAVVPTMLQRIILFGPLQQNDLRAVRQNLCPDGSFHGDVNIVSGDDFGLDASLHEDPDGLHSVVFEFVFEAHDSEQSEVLLEFGSVGDHEEVWIGDFFVGEGDVPEPGEGQGGHQLVEIVVLVEGGSLDLLGSPLDEAVGLVGAGVSDKHRHALELRLKLVDPQHLQPAPLPLCHKLYPNVFDRLQFKL